MTLQDNVIAGSVRDHFKSDSRLSGQCLDAEVSDRDVVIVGCVDSEDLKRVAEEVARGVPGVRHVASQVEVKSTDG